MRFMIIRKADSNTEAGVMPSSELLEAMAAYNQQLIEAGVLLDGMGLQPSDKGALIKFKNGVAAVTDGPFAETKELIAGFTLIQVASKQEAIEWVKRWPSLDADGHVELELRQVFELEDFEPGEGIDHHKRNQERMQKPKLQLNPYLNFNGNCRAALEYYEKVLGGKIEAMMTFGESPVCDSMPKELSHHIMHGCLNLGQFMLMGSDCMPGQFEPNKGISNSLNVEEVSEAERIFTALAKQGTIIMPLAETFWAKRFGMLIDQFGIQWMVNCQ